MDVLPYVESDQDYQYPAAIAKLSQLSQLAQQQQLGSLGTAASKKLSMMRYIHKT